MLVCYPYWMRATETNAMQSLLVSSLAVLWLFVVVTRLLGTVPSCALSSLLSLRVSVLGSRG